MEKNIRISAVVGIDPGSNGGIVTWRPDHNITAIKMPEDINDIRDYLNHLKTICSPIVFLEKLSVRPDDITPGADGVNMGKLYRIQKMLANFEQLKAIITVAEIPFVLIAPISWQQKLRIRIKNEDKKDRKKRFKDIAQSLYPEIKQTMYSCDATLIMHFGRYMLANNMDWIKSNLPNYLHNRLWD